MLKHGFYSNKARFVMSQRAENSDDDRVIFQTNVSARGRTPQSLRASAIKDCRASEALPAPIVLAQVGDAHQRGLAR